MTKLNVIAIDGPAGCGKSTLTKMLAKKHNLNYIDTGAIFRAVGLYLHNNHDDSFPTILEKIKIHYSYKNESLEILLNENNVSQKIREHVVSGYASHYSKQREVRSFVERIERQIVSKSSRISILEGRDIGTIVFPQAKLKIFLTASSHERAKRRYFQLEESRQLDGLSLEEIQKDIEQRDFDDMNRDIAPLKQANDAIEIDTTHLEIEEVFSQMDDLLQERFSV